MKFFVSSVKHAIHGLRYVFFHEKNFRIHIYIAIVAVIAMYSFSIPLYEKIIVWVLIIFVLVLELLNTAFEKILDILKPRLHSGVGVIKDIVAAAVFIAALFAFIFGCVVFFPYIIELFGR